MKAKLVDRDARFIIEWMDRTRTRSLKPSTVSVYFRKYYNDIRIIACVQPAVDVVEMLNGK